MLEIVIKYRCLKNELLILYYAIIQFINNKWIS